MLLYLLLLIGQVTIDGPEQIAPGKLQVFDFSKSESLDLQVQLLPPSENFVLDSSGKLAYFVGLTGNYTLIVAGAKEGKCSLKVHPFTVTGNPPLPTIPVKTWLPATYSKDTLIKMMAGWQGIISLIDSGTLTDAQTVLSTLAASNRATLAGDLETFKPFLTKMSEYWRGLELSEPKQFSESLKTIIKLLGE